MAGPFYCSLYVDTGESRDELSRKVKQLLREELYGRVLEVLTYRNDIFEAAAEDEMPYDFIKCSRYYLEVYALEEETPDQMAQFQSGVAELISDLRKAGRFVTASCVFEELITEKTGWNWTTDDPEPPGRMRKNL